MSILIYCADSITSPENECLCVPEVTAVDITNQDIFITFNVTNTENCQHPIGFIVQDTCYPDMYSSCKFNKTIKALLTTSLIEQCEQIPPNISSLTLNVSSSDTCSREIEMNIQCETGMNVSFYM